MENKREERLIDGCFTELLRDLGTSGLFQDSCDVSKIIENSPETTQIVDILRVCIKYLLFDRDCLKRENQSLKKLLDEDV